ncbi:conserved hypothetical protein, membrane [Beggiatoa sp. PS]|nr:conserved hypothetical protein, membrane [Beggiatoa sp. PS]
MAQTKIKVDEANHIVKKYMAGSMVVGLVPIPCVDLVALIGIQLKMLHRLANLYKIEFSKQKGKSLIASLLGGGIPVSLSGSVFSLVKGIPFYGQITGMISMSVFSGASTYAIGKVFTQHFESGGTFLSFEPKKVTEYYEQQFEIGKAKIQKSYAGIKP